MTKRNTAKKPAQKQKSKKETASPLLTWVVLGIVALLVGYALVRQFSNPGIQNISVTEITVEEAKAKYDEGAFILDVREPDEWVQGHIPNATLIPLGQLAERVEELPKDREIVVVCRSGNRSREGAVILLKAGFEQVSSMTGGMNNWTAAGYPVVTGE